MKYKVALPLICEGGPEVELVLILKVSDQNHRYSLFSSLMVWNNHAF